MAGIIGFEPMNGEIKTRCLTAWRYPNKELAGIIGFEPMNGEIKTRCLTAWRYPSRNCFICASTYCLYKAWCGRRDLNSHTLRYWNLNPARLPIPPLPQILLLEFGSVIEWWLRPDLNRGPHHYE